TRRSSDLNIKFTEGNCYGLIGANGSGKSTFLKILSGELDAQSGHVSMGKNERLAILKQDHFAYENERVIDVVIKGYERLYEVMKEKDEIYMKPDFSDEIGRASCRDRIKMIKLERGIGQ